VRAIFLDRDGVICENRPDHVKSWDEFRFLPGALAGLAQLFGSEFAKVVVTNQAVINRGIVSASALNDIHARMLAEVERTGGHIDRVMICPHRPDENCVCRKPRPGMIFQAAAEMGIRRVIIPRANLRDVLIEDKYQGHIDIVPVDTLSEVLDLALVGPKKSGLIGKLAALVPKVSSDKPAPAVVPH